MREWIPPGLLRGADGLELHLIVDLLPCVCISVHLHKDPPVGVHLAPRNATPGPQGFPRQLGQLGPPRCKLEGDVQVSGGEELPVVVLPSDQPIRQNVPGRVGPSVGEADDKHGVGLDTTTRDWVAGVNITSGNPNTSLRHDGPRARLKVALVPHHPSDLVLDLLGQEKTWPVGMVRAGDDEVPFETTLACLVQVPLKALDLQLQGRQVFSLSVNLTLLLLEHMTVYSDALDQGGRHLH